MNDRDDHFLAEFLNWIFDRHFVWHWFSIKNLQPKSTIKKQTRKSSAELEKTDFSFT